MKCLLWLTSNCGHLGEIVEVLTKNHHQLVILLAQDGVFLLDKGSEESQALRDSGAEIFVIQEHAEERGLTERLVVAPTFIDFSRAVQLMMEGCDRVITL